MSVGPRPKRWFQILLHLGQEPDSKTFVEINLPSTLHSCGYAPNTSNSTCLSRWLSRFLLEFNISSFWHSDNLADAHKHKKLEALQPCDTEYPVFVYEATIKETNGIIECGDCRKMFVVQQIINSNLLLLVTDAACDCSIFPPVLLQPKEVKYIFPLV
uniref:Uncharacterized protein n=1 Tax=Sphaerodactylus townsendi TaxID=933632 RepID=A0ACB8FM92_9SAUR